MAAPSPSAFRPLDHCLAQIHRSIAFRSALMDPVSTPTPPPLLDALKDAVSLFTELQIPYALVGGLAAMVYGRARFTEDVDLVAASTHQATLAANPDAMRRHHFDPAATWKLYHVSGISIDIWKDAHSDAIASRAATVTLAGLPVRIADVHDLVAMKLRAGRPQDDYDITEILKATPLDEDRLRALLTPESLARLTTLRGRT